MPAFIRAFTLSAVALCANHALAGEIYRCQVNGVTTFVDSPSGCPEGKAQRMGGAEPKGSKPTPSAGTSPIGSATPTPKSRPPISDMPTAASSKEGSGTAAAACQKLATDPPRARECLRQERRVEVQRMASARLASISRAVTEHLTSEAQKGSVIATANEGRPPAWCEGILSDLMAQKDIEVVDDESTAGPAWVSSGDGPGYTAAEILDPSFKDWSYAGSKVPNGYVTVRWRKTHLVVLRVVAACVEADDGTARCNPSRLTVIYVYDNETPYACNVTAVGRPYWPNWKDSMTPILTKLGKP